MGENKDELINSTHEIADILIYLGEVGSKLKLLKDIELSRINHLIAELENLEILSKIVEHKESLEKKYTELPPEVASTASLQDLCELEPFLTDKEVFPQRKDIADFMLEVTSLDVEPEEILGHRPRKDIVRWAFKKLNKQDIANIRKLMPELYDKNESAKGSESSLRAWFKEIEKM